MTWISNMLREPTLYWDPPTRDGLGGYVWNVPVELLCKWQSRGDLIYDSTGAQVASSGEVFCPSAVVNGGYLLEGSLPAGDPPKEAKQILLVDKIKTLSDSSVIYYKAYLE